MAGNEELRDDRDGKGRFLSGNIGGPGRPKGSRNKLGEAFTEALYADFQRDGIAAIERMRVEDPSGYVRVIAGLLPKQVEIERNPLAEMSDDELSNLIDLIRAADGAAVSARSGGKKEGGSSVAH